MEWSLLNTHNYILKFATRFTYQPHLKTTSQIPAAAQNRDRP